MIVDCLSCCEGFAASIGFLEAGFHCHMYRADVKTLMVWRTDNTTNPAEFVTFLDSFHQRFEIATSFDDKFLSMDVQNSLSCDNASSELIVAAVTRSCITRWKISASTSCSIWECIDYIVLEAFDVNVHRIVLSGSGALSATFDSMSGRGGIAEKKNLIAVRNSELQEAVVFNSSQHSSEAVIALLFHSEDLLLAAYEKGRILGWDVAGKVLLFDCKELLSKVEVCSLSINSAELRFTEKAQEFEQSHSRCILKLFTSLTVGCRNGKLRIIEIDNLSGQVIYRETSSLDLQKDTRYLQETAEQQDVKKPDNLDFVTTRTDFSRDKDRRSARYSRPDPTPSLRKEACFIPISLQCLKVKNCKNGPCRNDPSSGAGFLLVATPDALMLIGLSPLTMQRHIPLAALGINTISNCSVGVTGLDRERGGGGGGVRAAAVMMTAFQRKAVTFALHVDHLAAQTQRVSTDARERHRQREEEDDLKEEEVGGNADHPDKHIPRENGSSGDLLSGEGAVANEMGEGGDGGRGGTDLSHTVTLKKKKAGWLHPLPTVAVVPHAEVCDGEPAASARDAFRHTDISNCSSVGMDVTESVQGDGGSFYADLSVPLSLFLVEGVIPHATAGFKTILPSPSTTCGPSNTEKDKEKEVPKAGDKERVKDSWESPLKDKSGRVVDQPVTFQTHLRSSGYGQQVAKKTSSKSAAPRRQSVPGLRPSTSPSSSLRSVSGVGSGPRIRVYPRTCDPMTVHQGYNDYPLVRGASSSVFPAYAIAYSCDASQLAIASGDCVVGTLKLPVSRNNGDGQSLLGHNGRITGVCYSHDRKMLLSSSADGTAMLWSVGSQDSPSVIISHTKHQASPSSSSSACLAPATSSALSTSSSSVSQSFARRVKLASFGSYAAAISAVDSSAVKADSRNRPFGAEINAAKFFYMDKFVLLSTKASVNLYKYQSEREGVTAKTNKHSFKTGTLTSIADLNKKQSTGTYERVCEWSLSPAQCVTALACVNSIQSPIALCATSDRKLHVLDAAVGCVARSMDCSHERAVHCIALPTPSIHAQVHVEAYNLFATAATDNVVSLWDLRAPSVVFRYSGHLNRRECVSIALSPCLRFLATGSEDRSARIVDVRGGKEIAKLQGHRDVVSGVAFNPLFPQLATCSFDGSVKFYVDPAASDASMKGL